MLKKIQPICQTASLRTYDNHSLWLVYAPHGTHQSEIGNTLCDRGGADFVAIWWEESDGGPAKYHVSFRSKKGMDVNAIANHFGGAGHKTASSCSISTHPESLFRAAPQQRLHVVAYQQSDKTPSTSSDRSSLKRSFDMI